jgi:hypothetical protein
MKHIVKIKGEFEQDEKRRKMEKWLIIYSIKLTFLKTCILN